MSECQPLPAYQTRAIYFVQIRVSSLFTHCLCFYFWSFISFTYTRSLLGFFAWCCYLYPGGGTHRRTQAGGVMDWGKKYTTFTRALFLRSFYDTALCSKAGFYCISHWLNLHSTRLPVQIGCHCGYLAEKVWKSVFDRFCCQKQYFIFLARNVIMWESLFRYPFKRCHIFKKHTFCRINRGAESDKRQMPDRQWGRNFKCDATLNNTIQTWQWYSQLFGTGGDASVNF